MDLELPYLGSYDGDIERLIRDMSSVGQYSALVSAHLFQLVLSGRLFSTQLGSHLIPSCYIFRLSS